MSLVYDLLTQRHPNLFNNAVLLTAEPSINPSVYEVLRDTNTHMISWHLPLHQEAVAAQIASTFLLPNTSDVQGYESAILVWPKSKVLGCALVQLLACQFQHIYVVGANNMGGKSIHKACDNWCDDIQKIDSAKHCTLWQLTLTPKESFNWLTHSKAFAWQQQEYITLPGVFSHASLDAGTRLLLSTLPAPSEGSLVDLGCGSGVIGLSLKHTEPALSVTLADIDACALKSAQLNALRQRLDVAVVESDVLSGVEGRVDFVVTNPPFHDSKATSYHFAKRLFDDLKQTLKHDGQLWLVANRHLPYEQWAQETFGTVEIVAQDCGFKVLLAHDIRQ